MNSKLLMWLPILVATLLLASCEENEVPIPTSDAPTVSILSPAASDSAFASGDPILIQVQFDDDDELHEMLVTVIRLHDGAMVFQQHLHQHGSHYRWINTLNLNTTIESEFEVRAIVTDHELQRSTDTVVFTLLP